MPRLHYPLEYHRFVGGSQSLSGRRGEEKSLLLLPAFELWSIQPVTQLE